MEKRYLQEPVDELIAELQMTVAFPGIRELFYTDREHEYISNRIIDYENRRKDGFSKKELIDMVNIILDISGEEHEIDNLLLIVEDAVNKDVSNYIYYSDEDLTAEQIIEKALLSKFLYSLD